MEEIKVRMEGQLWKVRWKAQGGKFCMFVVGHPKIKVSASTLDAAREELEDKIAEELGDAVSHLEFVNALPSERRTIFTLAGHNQIQDIENLDALLDRPRCRKCGNLNGQRTNEPIRLPKPVKDDLSFTELRGEVISGRLARFLKLHALSEVRLIPLEIAGKKSRDFFEVVSLRPRPFVAIKGVKASQAFRCESCGTTVMMYMPHEAKFLKYVAEDSLPAIPVFPVGIGYKATLAVSNNIRNAVVRSKTFRNVVSYVNGVLPPDQSVSLDDYFRTVSRQRRRERE